MNIKNENNISNKSKGKDLEVFPIPVSLGEIKENITLNTNNKNKPSKEQIMNKAFKFHSQGNISEAIKYYQYFLNEGFKDQRVFTNYGVILKDLSKLKEAELLTRKAIELDPNYANAYNNLGLIMTDIGELKEAELLTRKAIKINPNYANAYVNLGLILKDLGKSKEAEISMRKAIKIEPNSPSLHSNLGSILKDLGKLKEAEKSIKIAIKLNPFYAEAHSNLGSILKDLGKLEEAEKSTRKAIELKPDFAEAYLNLGTILSDLGKLKKAILNLQKSIKIKPNYAKAYLNLSLIELLLGDYALGLDHYEFRDKIMPKHADPKVQKIDNLNLQPNEKLLIVSEQGLGDTIQYMRYIPYLRDKGIDISFCAQEKLHTLIRSSGIDPNPIVAEQANKISEGKWMRLLSLPKYLNIRPGKPIISRPYIFTEKGLIKKWKKLLSKEDRPIIGINWQGNPNIENTYQGRSIPLEIFSIIHSHNDLKMLSLQKGFGSDQLNHCSFKNKFVECQSLVDSTWDFLENAAIIENCDLIITCDTSIAHLAGGMGKKVWLLLRDIPYWTWGLEHENTFWYPSMRLFRQSERHNWTEVIKRVSESIKSETFQK